MRGANLMRAVLVVGSFLSSVALAQGNAVLTGTVTDAASGKPVADVVVTATSPALQGEEIVVTDGSGLYRIPQLPPGVYTLRLEKEQFKPYSRGDITLRVDRTIRLNVQIQPEAIQAEEVVVVGKSPTVDVGSTTTGLSVGKDFVNNIPFVQPNGSGTRSFESLASVAPQVVGDAYGFGINGTTSPENQILIDGVSVNDPALGINGANLPVDFVEEVNVITGGYLPEYGRATGGVLNVITKSGSNEFHGSVFGNFTPGALQGPTPSIVTDANTFTFQNKLWNSGDFGVELGGPILKDRLWFYAGFSPSLFRARRTRVTNQLSFDKDSTGQYYANNAAGDEVAANDPSCTPGASGVSPCRLSRPTTDANGNQLYSPIPDGTNYRFNDARAYNYIAKLTFLISSNQNLALSVSGANTTFNAPTFNAKQLAGTAITADNLDVSLKYTAGFLDKHLLIDATAGWHHQLSVQGPNDGSQIGDTTGAAGTPGVVLRKSSPIGYGIRTLETLPTSADGYCDPKYPELCPATSASTTYNIGGAFYMQTALLDRFQGKLQLTYLLQAAGHHVFKAGADVARTSYNLVKGYGGGDLLRDSGSGGAFRDYRRYAYLSGPDELVPFDPVKANPASTEIGAFIQDSWSILDVVTVNAGLRYDQQYLYGGDGQLGLSLNGMWSPRVGIIYDFTQRGQSKIFASYAKYYESVPLDIADRSLTGESQAGFNRAKSANATRQGCDPITDIKQANGACLDKNNYTSLASATDPSQLALVTGHGKSPVDPNLSPQNGDEVVAGAEYEVIQDGRLGLSYTKRWINTIIEDMSRDEANTYFLGNPGYGIAKDFPKATRDYDAVTLYFSKSFSDLWQAQVSYTWSYLRGNYNGLFRPEDGQLDPNINSDFDLVSLLANRTGPLSGDRTHVIKAYGAKEFVVNGSFSLVLGLAYNGRSGAPLNYLAAQILYGPDQAFVLPRGSAGRGPWIHSIDGKLSGVIKVTKENAVTLSVDIFNMFNFAGATSQDETFSTVEVLPYTPPAGSTLSPQEAACIAGSNPNCVPSLKKFDADTGTAVQATKADFNPNFKRVTSYQQPLTVRFGVKVTF